ncbi:hypothetical protein EZI54_21520 [Marinobacter halodurans]|uniref:Uncharacterized protein n=1 Tax=Marinobacter halodurans TaxID=2528979 RepID=A0ABY1ZEA3_9GAMM|nr:hypothetical protein [Marinobacter halodurans]TBW48219.1 hypothetical protein EZI54_21520 [Marinobacter halodurans]
MRNHRSTLIPLVVLVTLLAGCQVPATDTLRQPLTIQSPTGESMQVIQVLRPNSDGSYTLVALEPEKEVKAFYERACQAEYGPAFHYVGPDEGDTVLSEDAITGYVCESGEPLVPDP